MVNISAEKFKYPLISLTTFFFLCIQIFTLPVHAACPPSLKIISSQPANKSKDADPSAPIIITWDKTTHALSSGEYDYKTILESINIAGGRYGLGALLTTEWGIGGKSEWNGNKQTITPETPLEPGTQYMVWTYTYTSGMEVCPKLGGEIIFITSGTPPDDNKPVRKLDLSNLYHGNETGSGKIEGEITSINNDLSIITIKENFLKSINIILHEGIMITRNGNFGSLADVKVGDDVTGEFMGGRLYMLTAKGTP